MSISILHLSDFHFREGDVMPPEKIDSIAAAAVESIGITHCVIVASGDIAYAGTPGEYACAAAFFDSLRQALTRKCLGLEISTILAPGNHDCDFKTEGGSVREIVLASLRKTQAGIPDPDVIRQCLSVQRHYRAFLVQQTPAAVEEEQGLRWQTILSIDGLRVAFNVLNSAMTSRLKETPATLWYPHEALRSFENVDLVVSVLHHPVQWLDPEGSRALRGELEAISDVILTGHEHTPDSFGVHHQDESSTLHVEGGVLLHGKDELSSFNVILLLPDRYQVKTYWWSGSHYEAGEASEAGYVRSKRCKGILAPTDAWQKKLNDPGASFTHPGKSNLTLEDVFVFPDLDERREARLRISNQLPAVVLGPDAERRLLDGPHTLVFGADKAGKTTLCRRLFRLFLEGAQVPLFLCGESLACKPEDLDRFVEAAVVEQYGRRARSEYLQLDASQRVLIVDDFDKCKDNRRSQGEFLALAKKRWGRIVLVASDLFELEELLQDGEAKEFQSFSSYEIRPLGFRGRDELIEKWFSVGEGAFGDATERAHRVHDADKLITNLLGKNLLPAYPLFVLIMLQSYEAFAQATTSSGSYAFYYENLIMRALERAKGGYTPDTVCTATAFIAYAMMKLGVRELSPESLQSAIRDYNSEHDMNVEVPKLLTMLKVAGVVETIAGGGGWKFKYRYCFYYFGARYLRNALQGPSERETRDLVNGLIDRQYVEDNANLIVFLVYLSPDPEIIERVLKTAQSQFADVEPNDLDTGVGFANRWIGSGPARLSVSSSGTRDRREQKANQDQHAIECGRLEPLDAEEALTESARLNGALKTVQIMGQILRSYPGSLRGEVKLALARESVDLGLRTLERIFQIVQLQEEGLASWLQDLLRDLRGVSEKRELAQKGHALLFGFTLGFGYGIVKRLSEAVGSEHLGETYERFRGERKDLAGALIDLSIRLDNYSGFPEPAVIALKKRIGKTNLFSYEILRLLVRDRFLFCSVGFKVKQRVCELLDIDFVGTQRRALAKATGGVKVGDRRAKRGWK